LLDLIMSRIFASQLSLLIGLLESPWSQEGGPVAGAAEVGQADRQRRAGIEDRQ
jgi:hypothetical protein